MQELLIVYGFCKIGFAANDAAFSLKLVEHGLGKEDLAIAVLIDFPFQIFGGWIAARYSMGDKPLRPWLLAFWPRLGFCVIGLAVLYWFQTPPVSMGFFIYLVIHTVLMNFTQYVCSPLPLEAYRRQVLIAYTEQSNSSASPLSTRESQIHSLAVPT